MFPKGFSKEVFVIKKFKNNISWTYVIEELDGEETVETKNLRTVSVDLSKLSNAGNKDADENTAYNELVRKVNAI